MAGSAQQRWSEEVRGSNNAQCTMQGFTAGAIIREGIYLYLYLQRSDFTALPPQVGFRQG